MEIKPHFPYTLNTGMRKAAGTRQCTGRAGANADRRGGNLQMQVEIKIDDACRETKIIILTDKMTEEINSLVRKISAEPPQVLSGFRGDTAEILEQPDILRIYASSGKVLAVTEKGEYTLRLRLYELEERLDPKHFVRISH